MKLSSSSIWFTGAVLALLAGAHFLFVRPANRQRDALQEDTARKQAAAASFDRSADSFRALGGKVDALRPALALFDSRLSAGGDTNKVLEEIWRLADANSLQTRTVKTPSDRRTESFREQEIELSLSGNFSGFYQFLLKLEDMNRIVRIRKLNLKKSAAREGQVQADLTLSVFFAAGAS
jgi:Tfp pilus assembly protein PilO